MANVPLGRLALRIRYRWRKMLSASFARRSRPWPADRPAISFSFDDFPRSAWLVGGRILEEHGARGTFYASFGLLGTDSVEGPLFTAEDARALLAKGHEIGCHTHDHLDAWETTGRAFEESVIRNAAAAAQVLPGLVMETLSYPKAQPRPAAKRAAGRHFACVRGGGQTLNTGTVDLNSLNSFFIDKRNREDPARFQEIIDRNSRVKGWLIFSTHDLGPSPSDFGCLPEFFEDVVKRAVASGARILPVREVCRQVFGSKGHREGS